jgi:tetratricopeptide (TPR) repeat protein
MSVDHPVLGTGIGSYQIESPPYWNDFQKRWFARSPETKVAVDNEYLTVAAESGVLGLAASILIVSISCAYFLAACRRTACGRAFYLAAGIGCGVVAAAVNAFFSTGFHEPTVLFYYFFLLAMIEVIARGDEHERTQAADSACRKRRATYYPVWAVLIPVTLLVPFFVARPLAYHQHMKAGRDHARLEHFDEAMVELEAAFHICPSAWEPLIQGARNLVVQGETSQAAWGYKIAAVFHPNHLVALVNGGQAFLESDKPEAAIRWLEKAVRLTPYIPSTRYSLGEAYAAVENWGAALESFDAAEERGFSDVAGLRLSQYTCLYRLGQHSWSDERLEELLRLEPEDPRVWYEIGRLEFERDRTSAALAALNKALSLSEQYRPEPSVLAGIHCRLALFYLEERDDVFAASRHTVRALGIDPANGGVTELVKTLVELAKSDEVRAEHASVLPQFLYNVGAALSLSRVDEDPEPLLEEAAALAGQSLPILVRDARVRLAEHKLKLRHYSAARANLDVAEGIDPFDHNIFRLRGDVYAAMEMYDQAREAYLHALHIRPADVRSMTGLRRIEGLDQPSE